MYLLRANNKYNTSLYQAAKVGDTVIYVNAVPANLPTEITLEYGFSTEETVTVVSAGTNSLTLQAGQSLTYPHSIGASVQCLNQADFLNIFATDFEQDHDKGGYHHIANFGLSDYVISGLSIPTSAGLASTSTSGVAYITGTRMAVASDGGHTYTANQDTYVDVDNAGVYHYQGVSNGASAPSLTASSIRIAKVITNGSAVTNVIQFGADSNSILIYPIVPYQKQTSIRNINQFGLSDYVVSGITAPTSGSLSTTFIVGVAYIKGYQINVPSDGGHTYTASQDTYVDIDWNGVYHYQAVANGVNSPALTANAIRVAKVVSSGTAITSVTQSGFDSNYVWIYPTSPVQNINPLQFAQMKYRCRVGLSGTQSIPNSVNTKVNLTNKYYDPNNNFDTTNNWYVVPVSGYYHMIGVVLVSSAPTSGGGSAIIYFESGTSNYQGVSAQCAFASIGSGLCVSDIYYLNAGDKIGLHTYNSSPGSVTIFTQGGSQTYLVVHFLSF